jgi:signal transduction histidine kinase
MEKTFYYVRQLNGDYLFDNFPTELKHLALDFKECRDTISISIGGTELKARIGLKKSSEFQVYVLSTESKFVNRLKFFRELVNSSSSFIKPILSLQQDLNDKHEKIVEEFIHNATSLNTYSIQDLFFLIPQDRLIGNINKQKDVIREIIKDKPNVTVDTLLKQIKYSLATKVEFSVFERTVKNTSVLQKSEHSIRPVVLSILQIFISDFDKKNIEVHLGGTEKVLEIDFDSLFVSLYYIFDNAVKYCCPRTDFKIRFSEEKESFDIIITMVSIEIKESERKLITERNYRSEVAKKINEKGLGIGMYRIIKTLKFNNAKLEINPRAFAMTKDNKGIKFEGNEFRVVFSEQNKWI